jgi:tripartite ATP-independent transporter DctP family solute receptor
MRRRAARWLGLLTAMAVVAGGASLAWAQQVTLRLAHYAPEAHPAHLAAKQLAARVEERTRGQVKIAIAPHTAPEQLDQVKSGAVDLGLTTPAALEKYDRAFATLMLPFAFDDAAHAHRFLDGGGMAWLAPLAERQGFIILANWEGGFRQLTNGKRPIVKPDDVKGLKIRVGPEMQLEAAMEALGATPAKIAVPELYRALSQGVVDGQEGPIEAIAQHRYHEVQKHLALTRHVYSPSMLVIGFLTLTKLRPEHQRILREESQAAAELMRTLVAKDETEQIAKLRQAGMAVSQPDVAAFRAAMGPAYKRIATYAGERNVQLLVMLADEARKR